MKILVLDCLASGNGERRFSRDFIGAGPRIIAGLIEEMKSPEMITKIIRIEDFLDENQLKINISSFSILCISAMTMDIIAVKRAIEVWKKYHDKINNTLIFLGGPITADDLILNKIDADIAFIGQAEYSLSILFGELFEYLLNYLNSVDNELFFRLDKIPNIIFKDKVGQIQYGPKLDPNEIPTNFFKSTGYPEKIMDYSDFRFARVYVEIVRGCSNFRRTSLQLNHNISCMNNPCKVCRGENFSTSLNCPAKVPPGCGFCSTITQFGMPQSREILYIVNEIKVLIGMGVHRIVLGGPDFLDFFRGPDLKHLYSPILPKPNYQLLENLINELLEIKEIREQKVQLFVENIKASLVDDKVAKILSRIPKCVLSIGCETGSNKFADILGRPNSPEQTLEAIKILQKYNIRIHVYFIHSLPGDTVRFASQTLKFIQRLTQLNIEKITLYKFQKLPGSPFDLVHRKYLHFNKDYFRVVKKIKDYIKKYNTKKKEELLGRTLLVYLAEPNKEIKSDAMGWILEGGPKVAVKNGIRYLNSFKMVKIKKILSDRLIYGEIIDYKN